MGLFNTIEQFSAPYTKKNGQDQSHESENAPSGKVMTPPPFALSSSSAGALGTEQMWDYAMSAFTGGKKVTPNTQQPQTEGKGNASPGGDAELIEFTLKFNERFKSILHVFDPDGAPGKLVGLDEASGKYVTADQLKQLFTKGQRKMLLNFIKTNKIPEGLFNGDEHGGTNAKQRILISSEILISGIYEPGAFEQRVHAKNCGHWVQTVQNYAGVTPHDGINADRLNGNFDLFGNAVMGAGDSDQIYKGDRVYMKNLPTTETDEIGPIHEGTDHYESASERSPDAKIQPFRLKHLPFKQFDTIQPGDWLYIYNANGAGDHSVIFSHWASNPQVSGDGVDYRLAVTYDQNQPKDGGEGHVRRLGSRFSNADKNISPVTLISRVDNDSKPAETIDELLPTREGDGEQKLRDKNLSYIASLEKKYPDNDVLQRITTYLIAENQNHISYLGDRLTQGQRNLLLAANKPGNIEQLVRLTDRLRQLHTNAEILAKNDKKLYDEKLNGQYQEMFKAWDTLQRKINDEIKELELQKSPWEKKVAELMPELDKMGNVTKIKVANAELNQLRKDSKNIPPSDPEFKKNRNRRVELFEEITALKAEAKPYKAKVSELQAVVDDLKKEIRKVDRKIAKKEAELNEAYMAMPFGQVAQGGTKDQDTSKNGEKSTGDLQKLMDDAMIKGLFPKK